MKCKNKLVFGFGINNADYPVQPRINGIQTLCPFYSRWKSVLQRAKSERYKAKFPTYLNTSVCEDWKYFMNFRGWMEVQDWKGKEIDKDYLSNLNHYSPETCVFIPKYLNSLFTDAKSIRGNLPIGGDFQ